MQISMFTERQAIKDELEFIRQERLRIHEQRRALAEESRRLDNRFDILRKALNQLDELERHNLKAYDIEGVIGSLVHTVSRLSDIIPKVPANDYLTAIKRGADLPIDATKDIIDEEEVQESFESKESFKIKTSDIEVESSKEQKKVSNTKRRKNANYKEQAPKVVELLKEIGRPAKLGEISEMIEFEWGNPTLAIDRIMKIDPRIERVARGYFQVRS